MRHCKHTNKQSGEIQRWAKYTKTNTDMRGTTNTKDLIILDHPFKNPAEREKKKKLTMKTSCVYPAQCNGRKCTVSEDHNCGRRL